MIFSKIVLTHNEKKSSSDRENFKNSRLKAHNLQKKLRLLGQFIHTAKGQKNL